MAEETPIIDRNQLNQKIKDFGFISVEVESMNDKNEIYLGRDLESFLTLANTFEQKHIFFGYYFYEKNEYVIPESLYEEQTPEYQKKVQEHNNLVDQINFDSPWMLNVFIIKDGKLIGILLENYWIEEKNIMIAEDVIEEINFLFRPQNKAKKEDDEREIIFNDPEFKYCKNQDLRFEYLREFFEKEKHEKFLYLIIPSGGPMRGKAKMFLDKTWILYQDKLKKENSN